LLHRNIR